MNASFSLRSRLDVQARSRKGCRACCTSLLLLDTSRPFLSRKLLRAVMKAVLIRESSLSAQHVFHHDSFALWLVCVLFVGTNACHAVCVHMDQGVY